MDPRDLAERVRGEGGDVRLRVAGPAGWLADPRQREQCIRGGRRPDGRMDRRLQSGTRGVDDARAVQQVDAPVLNALERDIEQLHRGAESSTVPTEPGSQRSHTGITRGTADEERAWISGRAAAYVSPRQQPGGTVAAQRHGEQDDLRVESRGRADPAGERDRDLQGRGTGWAGRADPHGDTEQEAGADRSPGSARGCPQCRRRSHRSGRGGR